MYLPVSRSQSRRVWFEEKEREEKNFQKKKLLLKILMELKRKSLILIQRSSQAAQIPQPSLKQPSELWEDPRVCKS